LLPGPKTNLATAERGGDVIAVVVTVAVDAVAADAINSCGVVETTKFISAPFVIPPSYSHQSVQIKSENAS